MGFELLELRRRPSARFIIALGVLMFLINVVTPPRKPRNAPLDPWDARSYEWMTASPPKEHNFDAIPTVHAIDEFFHRKYEEDEERRAPARWPRAEEILAEQEAHADDAHPHAVAVVLAARRRPLGLPSSAIGLIFNYLVVRSSGVAR